MVWQLANVDAYALYRIVERLSTHDQSRIVQLIELFGRAPHDVREYTQASLAELIESEPTCHEECAAQIDAIIERAEQELENRHVIPILRRWAHTMLADRRKIS